MRSSAVKPLNIYDVRIASALGGLVVLLALWVLEDVPDPLPNMLDVVGGGGSGAIPVIIGLVAVPPLLYVLRRAKRGSQRILSFLAGVFVGLIPFLFYWSLQSYWTNSAPLSALCVRGLIGGSLLGTIAAWYVPRSTWARFEDSRELN